METSVVEQARRIVARTHAKVNAEKVSQARTQCFKLAMTACWTAGLAWLGFGYFHLFAGSYLGAAVCAAVTVFSYMVAWTATVCMSFNAHPTMVPQGQLLAN